MKWIDCVDLRSDTVTWPTEEMRAAMAAAELGDDVMGEDPTIIRLQELAAERMGMEAGLFVPSGTMGNLAAILSHCGRGDELIAGSQGHTFRYEAGGSAALGSVHTFTLPNQPDGTLDLDQVVEAIREDDEHEPVTRLLILENTQNRCGGMVLGVEYMRRAALTVREHGLKLHIDGARIFNAAAALGVPVRELTQGADSVTFCLSKGLCCPAGSVLCGSGEFIKRAHRMRKVLGGAMRQAGVLAAAGIVALEKMTDRLAEDHRRARNLAAKISRIPGLRLDHPTPDSNMVFCSLTDEVPVSADEISARLQPYGVLVYSAGARRFRLVTHYWVDDEKIERAAQAFRAVMRGI